MTCILPNYHTLHGIGSQFKFGSEGASDVTLQVSLKMPFQPEIPMEKENWTLKNCNKMVDITPGAQNVYSRSSYPQTMPPQVSTEILELNLMTMMSLAFPLNIIPELTLFRQTHCVITQQRSTSLLVWGFISRGMN